MDQTVLPKSGDGMEVHATLDTFDVSSGSKFERMLFNNRIVFLLLCAVLTVFLGFQALKVRINADYNDTIPLHQAFIVNYLHHFEELQSQANAVQISVTTDNGNIIDPHYLNVLQKISDQVYLLPGVNRPFMTSLWTSNTRWVAVTADGLDSGPVISNSYDGSPEQLQVVAGNIKKTSLIGKLISSNWKSSMIYVPLLEKNNMTRQPLNKSGI
jgi:predicted RND superfamily exporter protein